MSFASAINLPRIRRSASVARGFTMVEMLVALTVASIFLSGAYTTYIQVVGAQDQAESRNEAIRNGRTAMAILTTEIKELNSHGEDVVFVGIQGTQDYGDGMDNDMDGLVDEELLDGKDDDLTGASVTASDRHARLGSLYERPNRVNQTDLGDAGVDEDVRFGLDQLYIIITPTEPSSDFTRKFVNYFITEFDGMPSVLVRRTRIERDTGPPLIAVAPLAFGVLGLDLLYWDWDTSVSAQNPQWVNEWDSRIRTGAPQPSSVYIRLTLNADNRPDHTVADGEPIRTILLESIANIETVIGSNEYNNQRPNL